MQHDSYNPPLSAAETIQNEYRRLDERWMNMQYQAILWMVLFTTAAEITMAFVLHRLDMIGTSAIRYSLKYVAAPLGANLLLLVADWCVLRSRKVSVNCKIYTVSLTISLCCFVICTVHAVFPALYLIYAIPMVLTVIYADRRLTTVVSVSCIAEKAVSDLFITWDAKKVFVLQDRFSAVDFFLSFVILSVLCAICLVMIRMEQKKNNFSIKLELERQHLQEEALTDALTGVGNRLALRKAFRVLEHAPHRRYVLAMADLDGLKTFNDQFGHTCGDRCLESFGRALMASCGPDSAAFRFGGDEFCLLIADATAKDAARQCEKIRRTFADEEQRAAREKNRQRITVSIGIAEYRPGEQPSALLERADQELYRAKQSRNRVCAEQAQMDA